jgi:mRNA interferase ChpB
MKRGDVYMVDLEPTQGREQRGHRPVVVVSPDDFNRATGLPVILPITNGGEFARRIGFAVALTGTRTTGVVRCDQPRVLDVAARNGRRVESLPSAIMDEVLAKAATIFASAKYP